MFIVHITSKIRKIREVRGRTLNYKTFVFVTRK
jgi:hypothetical protein